MQFPTLRAGAGSRGPAPRYHRSSGQTLQLGIILPAAFIAVLLGAAVALIGGIVPLAFVVVVAAVGLVLANYRLGIWLLVFLLPFAATYLMPRQAFGVTGLNPVNVILALTLIAIVVRAAFGAGGLPLPRPPLIFVVFLVMLAIAAARGVPHAREAISVTNPDGFLEPQTPIKYLLDTYFKPMVLVIVIWLAAGRMMISPPPRTLIYAVAAPTFIYLALMIGFILYSGLNLTVLASSRSRGFLGWMGFHANELGVMGAMLTALLVFAAGTRVSRGSRTFLRLAAAAALITTLLTFSRAAFLGLVIAAVYFLVSRRRFGNLLLAVTVAALVLLLLPPEIYDRAFTGVSTGDSQAVTAGRLDHIWVPLIPFAGASPIVGHGLSSTMWAPANIHGDMLHVSHPHSAYIAAILDFGLVGVAIIAAFYVRMAKEFRHLMRAPESGEWRGYFEGAFVCLLMLVIIGFTNYHFDPTYETYPLWLSFALAQGLLAKRRLESGRSATSGRRG